MARPHNPADYNLAANPSLPKTNSPGRVFGALILAAVACAAAWHLLRGPVRVSRPTLAFSGERVTATAVATNETDRSVQLFLRFVLAHTAPASDDAPARFDIAAQRDLEIRVPSHSSAPIHCEFPLPPHSGQLQAEVQILSRP